MVYDWEYRHNTIHPAFSPRSKTSLFWSTASLSFFNLLGLMHEQYHGQEMSVLLNCIFIVVVVNCAVVIYCCHNFFILSKH